MDTLRINIPDVGAPSLTFFKGAVLDFGLRYFRPLIHFGNINSETPPFKKGRTTRQRCDGTGTAVPCPYS